MDRYCGPLQAIVLSLLVLCGMAGQAPGKEIAMLQEPVPCSTTARTPSPDRWWQFYEQGLWYASRTSWQAAAVAFEAALQHEVREQRHIVLPCTASGAYFPHRELGIAYFHLGRYLEAQRELETSLGMVASAKAQWYLNRVRKTLLQRDGNDVTPPRLQLHRPLVDGWITRQELVEVTGVAEDDTYIARLTINGRPLLLDVAAPRVPFVEQIRLHEGPNTLDITAEDVLGQQTHQRLTVILDRHGPLVSLEHVERRGVSSQQSVLVRGSLFDHSPITHLQLGSQRVALSVGNVQTFRVEVQVSAETLTLPFEVADAAGNVTQGSIDLPAPSVPETTRMP